ncbi:MAG: hypothetical protein AAGC95_02495 [Pseudomonadota bacterium]
MKSFQHASAIAQQLQHSFRTILGPALISIGVGKDEYDDFVIRVGLVSHEARRKLYNSLSDLEEEVGALQRNGERDLMLIPSKEFADHMTETVRPEAIGIETRVTGRARAY